MDEYHLRKTYANIKYNKLLPDLNGTDSRAPSGKESSHALIFTRMPMLLGFLIAKRCLQ